MSGRHSLEPRADGDPGSSAACQDRGCHPVGTTAAMGAAGSSSRPRACWVSQDAERASWARCGVHLDAVWGSGHPFNRQSVGWGPQLRHCLGTCYKISVSDQSEPPGEGPSRCVLSQVLEGTWLCTRPENRCWRALIGSQTTRDQSPSLHIPAVSPETKDVFGDVSKVAE